MNMREIHRDDIDADEVARMEEKLRQQTGLPDAKIHFIGDATPAMRKKLNAVLEKLFDKMDRSMGEGVCFVCSKPMPDYDLGADDWKPTAGWALYSYGSDDDNRHWMWYCPECEAKGNSDEIRTIKQ